VKLSTDGGTTFPYTIFDRTGAALGTVPPQSSSFTPTASQWGTYAGMYATLTGVVPINSFTPSKFELVQNYPNPFNPTTNIRYQIANSSFVTLKVYDILGKEMKTLVSENLKAGTYEIKFDASNIPSGAYFYKITAGNFTDTKKMLVIK